MKNLVFLLGNDINNLSRGQRWPDLLRFHAAGTINVYNEVPNLNGKNVPLYFPIPKTQIDLNPNLVQTDGYQ